MYTSLVVTMTGTDRPGIVQQMAQVLAECNGHWTEGRMAKLSGQFAGVVRVQVQEARRDDLRQAMQALCGDELQLVVLDEVGEAKRCEGSSVRQQALRLDLVGADRPGIVRDISAILARQEVNVEELSTEISDSAMAAQPLFRASAELRADANLDIDALRTELEALSDELIIDLSVPPVA